MTEQQLLLEMLKFTREKYKKNRNEILIGEEGKSPEFAIVPYKRNENE